MEKEERNTLPLGDYKDVVEHYRERNDIFHRDLVNLQRVNEELRQKILMYEKNKAQIISSHEDLSAQVQALRSKLDVIKEKCCEIHSEACTGLHMTAPDSDVNEGHI